MSNIEWTDETWNPVAGCSPVSPGCDRCYAMLQAARLERMGSEKYSGLTEGDPARWTGVLRVDRAALARPEKWRRPRRVFVNSMSDLFHPEVPAGAVAEIWDVMARCPRHVFQVLTKRPVRMLELARGLPVLPNVWLGVSVESKRHLFRVAFLRDTPAAVRFVSFEPLLDDVLHGCLCPGTLAGVDWVIAGGESGPGARPMRAEWAERLLDVCAAQDIPFFFKQWGGARPGGEALLRGRTLGARCRPRKRGSARWKPSQYSSPERPWSSSPPGREPEDDDGL